MLENGDRVIAGELMLRVETLTKEPPKISINLKVVIFKSPALIIAVSITMVLARIVAVVAVIVAPYDSEIESTINSADASYKPLVNKQFVT